MEIKHSATKVTYTIEEKPGGGFIARPSDPKFEVLEGATNLEIARKVRDQFAAMVGEELRGVFEFGGIKLPLGGKAEIQRTLLSKNEDVQAETIVSSGSGPSEISDAPIDAERPVQGKVLLVMMMLAVLAFLLFVFFKK